MTRKKRYSNHEQLKTRKIMEQKTDYVFKEEQIDWKALAKVGIGKEQLAQDGNLDLLLQGRETDILPVRLKTAVIDLATDATLRIVENPAGIPVVEINGISSGDK
jgi:type II secretory ATPase GspE/PulE/Tfp pilus assembly ATPase PilB-like protein